MSFLVCRVHREDKSIYHQLEMMDEQQLSAGDVLIRIEYSGINFKDALGVTGKGKIYKLFPVNAGIDCAGIVESSSDTRFEIGEKVLVNGCGLGEIQDGGLAQKVRVPADWVIKIPEGLTSRTAMILGTAGFTAALAIDRMEQNDQTPEQGAIVVTGASGGVGSFAVSMLSRLGYEVIAVSGRDEHSDYLKNMGASKVVNMQQLALGTRPLEEARFAGAIDNVGGELLSGLIRHTGLWGNIACIGMAADANYQTTVFPLILRGVSLLGISSTNCPMPKRERIWQRIGKELLPNNTELIVSQEVCLADISPCFYDILARRHRGRILVNCE
ncbi:YhdH/YhfP family quinone oxidoreductase [Candidatus Nitrotoga sp. M5]|uniref:YhdH/YhfP family quinone oxidoreductase n=1 Tax=Candidatus Nitrotoga sp. M5 TaxID=2890409 RepID=UPI001EF4914E|nr:YhdH/YhfP family quinone oxidoreductase [Candidatus Nitrotoga sp. M5]CAH1387214.1 putative quinone oxidoreductase YhfP [Candidatus Nitrotoga sp. M5]